MADLGRMDFGDIVVFGPDGSETKIFNKDGSFRKSFITKFSKYLGPSAEEIIAQEQQQRLAEAERQQREAMSLLHKEMKNLRLRTERVQSQVDRERAKLAQIEKDRNEIEKRLNNTKAVDEQAPKRRRPGNHPR